jgi:hypothetical protein
MEADAVQQIMRRLAMIKNVAPLPGAAPAAASATTSAGTAAPVPAKPASGSGW